MRFLRPVCCRRGRPVLSRRGLPAPAQENQEKKEAPVIALTGGTLIDGNGGAPVPDAVVLIQGRKILQAGPAAAVKVPEKAEKIDVRGKFILPGFIDCHIHTTYPFNDASNPSPTRTPRPRCGPST